MTTRKQSGQRPLTEAEITERKEKILNAALSMIQTRGIGGTTRDAVAEKAGVSGGTVNRYFITKANLITCAMQRAVEKHYLPVVAQGIFYNHPVALGAPMTLRDAAILSVGGTL